MRTGSERRTTEGIRLYDKEDFEGMRHAGRLAAECLDMIGPHVVPGVRTEELDELCHEFILKHGATSAPQPQATRQRAPPACSSSVLPVAFATPSAVGGSDGASIFPSIRVLSVTLDVLV